MNLPGPIKTVWGAIDNRTAPRIGTSIWDREWDICCVLDGCRADTFRGEYADAGAVWSVASTSQTWIPRTFDDRDVSDVAYITGNPYAARMDPERFGYYHIEPVAETTHGIETVPPRRLADHAIDVWNNRDKLGVEKMVVHFMQPHVPFRGRPEWFVDTRNTAEWGARLWNGIGKDYTRDEWMAAYQDNLQWALEDGVKPIQQHSDGLIAVTADHGNAAGEWGVYGHPRHVPVPAVRRVPWHTFQGNGKPVSLSSVDEATTDIDTDEQLRALGYK